MTQVPTHGHWMQTYTGRAFDYLAPTPEMISELDVAHSLAHSTRFNGHTASPVNIAQHSLLVVQLLRDQGVHSRETLLQGLVHDAPEAYLSDIPAPLKRLLPEYRALEERVWAACAQHFGVNLELDPLVKEADWLACRAEAHAMLPTPPVAHWAEDYPMRELSANARSLLYNRNSAKGWRNLFLDELRGYGCE